MFLSPEVLEESLLVESNEKLQKLISKIEHLPLNIKHEFKSIALYGFLTDHIKSQVKEKKIDLIVMGTKGSTGLKSVSIGSNTGDVITKVPCTVLAVPEHAVYSSIKEIGFPSDFQLKYDHKILETLKSVLLLKKSALRLLYVSHKNEKLSPIQENNKRVLMEHYIDIECSFHIVTGKKIDDSIQCFTESRNLDMLVMVAKNLNFLERILFRPTVERISYHTKVPFLVIHES
jgi:nucleotide-binding universal stress UspA family protein